MQELRGDIRNLKHVVVEFSKPDAQENVAHLRLFVHEEQLPRAEAVIRAFAGRKRMKVKIATMTHLQPMEFARPGQRPTKAVRIRSGAIIVEGKVLDIAKMHMANASVTGVTVPPRPTLQPM